MIRYWLVKAGVIFKYFRFCGRFSSFLLLDVFFFLLQLVWFISKRTGAEEVGARKRCCSPRRVLALRRHRRCPACCCFCCWMRTAPSAICSGADHVPPALLHWGGLFLVDLCVSTPLVSSWICWVCVMLFCTTSGVRKAYETNEKGKSVKLYKSGLDMEGAMLKYCPTLRRGEEMLHWQVKCLVNSGSLADIQNYVCVFFFISRAP